MLVLDNRLRDQLARWAKDYGYPQDAEIISICDFHEASSDLHFGHSGADAYDLEIRAPVAVFKYRQKESAFETRLKGWLRQIVPTDSYIANIIWKAKIEDHPPIETSAPTLLEAIEEIRDQYKGVADSSVSYKTPGVEARYSTLRESLLASDHLADLTPSFIQDFKTLQAFWPFIKEKFPGYASRRTYLDEEFEQLIARAKQIQGSPVPQVLHEELLSVTEASIRSRWMKAVRRVHADPDGAITAARTLIEAVMKHIIDGIADPTVTYLPEDDAGKLFKKTCRVLNLEPDSGASDSIKKLLQGCHQINTGLAELRNKHGDAHGHTHTILISEKTVELAVTVAGAFALFLWKCFSVQRDESVDSG